jgi:hypothetical protein
LGKAQEAQSIENDLFCILYLAFRCGFKTAIGNIRISMSDGLLVFAGVFARDSSMRKAPILRRILNFLSTWDQKQKDREIERLLASSGDRFCDEIERRITEHVRAGDWSIHR